MWIFVLILPLKVLVGSAGVAVLCNERRPLVLLCLGGMVGMIGTSIALSLLGLLFGFAIATWLVLALLVLGGLAAIVYWWRKQLLLDGMEVSWKYGLLLTVLVVHFGLAAAVFWQFLIGAQGHQDVLTAHSAISASIARGNYPVVNPYQPDEFLPYRLTFHVIGAFLTRLSGHSAPETLTGLTGILIAFLFLGLVGLGLAARLGPWRTMLAAVIFLTVGNLRWLDILRQVTLENPAFNHHTLVYFLLSDFAGSALALSVGNPSLSYGYLVALCVLTFFLYSAGGGLEAVVRGRCNRSSAWPPFSSRRELVCCHCCGLARASHTAMLPIEKAEHTRIASDSPGRGCRLCCRSFQPGNP